MNVNSNEIGNLDTYIEQLLTCKPLKESDVKFLCEKVKEIDQQISPEAISTKGNEIKCGIDPKVQSLTASCPSECCGPSGQAIDTMGFGGMTDSPDCPNIYTVCYWKEFCKKLKDTNLLADTREPFSGLMILIDVCLFSNNLVFLLDCKFKNEILFAKPPRFFPRIRSFK